MHIAVSLRKIGFGETKNKSIKIIKYLLRNYRVYTSVITTSYYNQNKNSIVSEAGRGYARDGLVKPIITAPGIDALVAMPGGKKTTISGGSVAAAIVTGICALLLQWGIIDKNNESMYAVSIETYLIKGAKRIEGLVYPNDTWGYGIVNVKGIFESIRNEEDSKSFKSYEEYINNIFIRNPYRVYYEKQDKKLN